MIAAILRRLMRCDRGNVAIILALSLIPLTFVIGMGVDYTIAVDRQTQLNADADAAALAAVTPTMMAQSASDASTAAQSMFDAQASTLKGVSYNPKNVSVTINDNGPLRTATVTYNAKSQNVFPNILGRSSIAISGHSQAKAGLAPNINFYLLLDDSPSMAIAATPSGITTMVNNTQHQGGCAFGCHEEHPSSDNLGNPHGEDNYALARSLGVTLRIDLLRQAVQDLMDTAQTTENSNNATYQMALYTFDSGFNSLQPLTDSLNQVKSEASNIQLQEVYANNWLQKYFYNDDEDTNYDNAMQRINNVMPDPGRGTNTQGDSPQEVLFFVTDGVEDEDVNGSRQQSLMDPSWCTTIKNRGIRIAVLYTTYLPLVTNNWYNTYISPFQSQISSTLRSCASPGLFYEVQSGGDISAALIQLFKYAVQAAYLSQ